MLTEQGFDTHGDPTVATEEMVTAVFAHPYHGRLVERVILWVRPFIDFKGERYKLSWWGGGVAYYEPMPVAS
jgi:hypothetical protein